MCETRRPPGREVWSSLRRRARSSKVAPVRCFVFKPDAQAPNVASRTSHVGGRLRRFGKLDAPRFDFPPKVNRSLPSDRINFGSFLFAANWKWRGGNAADSDRRNGRQCCRSRAKEVRVVFIIPLSTV